MKTTRVLTWAMAAAGAMTLLAGCPHDVYTVELWPQGQQMRRHVKVEHAGGNATTTASDTEVMVGEQLPDDLRGNAGRYWGYESEFGTAGLYLERIRGREDPAGTLDAQNRAIDKLVDYLLAWTKQQFLWEREYPKLAKFLGADVRTDAKNIAVQLWMGDVARRFATTTSDSDPMEHAVARGVLYLIERGYCMREELPRLAAALSESSLDRDGVPEVARRAILRKIGLTDKRFAAKLEALLKTPEKALESFEKFVADTREFRKVQSDWEKRQRERERIRARGHTQPDEPKDEKPTVREWLIMPVVMQQPMLFTGAAGTDDRFIITLHTGVEPTATNGRWNEGDKTVVWDFWMHRCMVGVPAACHAVWAEPDEAGQKARLGRVALTGSDLQKYCLWRNSLSAERATEWAALVAKLKPDADTANAELLGAFRFRGETDQPEGAAILGGSLKARESK